MEFGIPIDDEARSVAPGIRVGDAVVELNEGMLVVRLGALLTLRVELGAVSGAALVPDPRPVIFLPPGVSSAVERFGSDVVCAIGSYDGLVRIDFTDMVEAETRPSSGVPDESSGTSTTVSLLHLIVNLEDPEGFVDALSRARRGGASRPST